jgi:uncharacterized membrane protein YfcA
MELILIISSILTAIISAVIGMGGGVLLLSIMTFFLPAQSLIPIHGVVQLISNSTRVFYLKAHVKWDYYKYFIIGLPLGAIGSTLLLKNIFSKQYIYLLLSLIIFYAVFKPKKLPEFKVKQKNWIFIGLFTGFLAILVGAVGPMLAVFFIRDDFEKEEIISTKAMMQLSAHLIKIPAFLYLDFDYFSNLFLISIMGIGVIIGTKLGVTILKSVDKDIFKLLFKSVLFIAGIRIAYKFLSFYF